MKFGIAAADITPPLRENCTLDGMPRKAPISDVLFPLEVVVSIFDDGKQVVILAVFDSLYAPLAEHKILEQLARTILPGCTLLTHATHSHSADLQPMDRDSPLGPEIRESCRLAREKGFLRALSSAMASLSPCQVAATRIPFADDPTSNRRLKMDGGFALSAFGAGPFIPPGHRCLGPAGPDPRGIDLLAFREDSTGRIKGLLTSHDSHIHFHPLSLLHGESAAAARREIRKRFPETEAGFFLGCAGDVANQKYDPPVAGGHEALLSSQTKNQEIFACRFADALEQALPTLSFQKSTSSIAVAGFDEQGFHADEHMSVDVLQLGPATFVGLPGEIFLDFQGALRAIRPDGPVFLATFNRGKLGYIATPLAFEEGSYEIMRGPAGAIPYATPTMPAKSSSFTGARLVSLVHSLAGQIDSSTGK